MSFRVAFVMSLLLPLPLSAQIRASEIGVMSQTIDGTKLTVEYSRPRARGRDPLFGTKAVQWDEVWTPGANYATTLEVDRNVKLNGKSVPKGKYSVWMVVKKTGDWTMVLDPRVRLYHMEHPESTTAQIRFPAKVEKIAFTDVLTWSMPELRMSGGKLVMDWERARVAMDVEVEPSLKMTLPASEATAYLGQYTFIDHDSTGKAGKVSAFTITHEDGTLKGRWTPDDPYMKKFALVRIAPDWFAPGVYDEKGQIYEVLKPDVVVEFNRTKGQVSGFVMRFGDDNLWGKATRKR